MGRGSASGKLGRLDQLLGQLKSGDPLTAARLAETLGVSLRTLMRDLDALRDQGYPIESEKGRGGGVRLYPRWGIGRLALNYREVVDLLLALNVLEKLDSPLFLANLSSVRNKLFATFPDSQRAKLRQIRNRILVGDPASAAVMGTYAAAGKSQYANEILESFFDQKRLHIRYQRADGETSSRTVEIHYLFLNWPVWYLIAWDVAKESGRTFRIDRIRNGKVLDLLFKPKPLDAFSVELEKFSKPL